MFTLIKNMDSHVLYLHPAGALMIPLNKQAYLQNLVLSAVLMAYVSFPLTLIFQRAVATF